MKCLTVFSASFWSFWLLFIVTTTTMTMIPSFYVSASSSSSSLLALDCDPCIDRQHAHLVAVLPAPSPTSTNENHNEIASAMQQTADDLNVQLAIHYLQPAKEDSSNSVSTQLLQIAAQHSASNNPVDAWIVNLAIADGQMKQAVRELQAQDNNVVIFGWGWGYESDVAASAAGWMASNEAAGARMAAKEFQSLADSRNRTLDSVVYVTNEPDENKGKTILRQETFAQELQDLLAIKDPLYNDTTTSAASLRTANFPITVDEAPLALLQLFENDCPHDAILFDSTDFVQQALEIRKAMGCDERTDVGVFLDDMTTAANPQVYRAITRGQVAFALNPQLHLQTSLPVLMAAVYATTGQKVSVPIDVPTYWTGPKLVHRRNVPSDTGATCEQNAFPICGDDETSTWADATAEDICPCTDRKAIRIGGVVHGRSTSSFWGRVVAGAEQAAVDMNVELDLVRFEPQEDFNIIIDQMAARIRNLCDSGGVDGLFVSIPSPVVAEAVQRCLDLSIPVISINSGVAASRELGLIHHIGQNEYAGGYGAAQRLMADGMKRGCK